MSADKKEGTPPSGEKESEKEAAPLSAVLEEEQVDVWANTNLEKLGLSQTSTTAEQKAALRWAVHSARIPTDELTIERCFVRHVEYTLAQTRRNLNNTTGYRALSLCMRDRLIERWKDTQIFFQEKNVKRVAYLSMEYLLGRSLQNSIVNLTLGRGHKAALHRLGLELEELYEEERDAGLGNGGLGRLAACFMDSLATLDLPAWGYGLRYTYGMFQQRILNGEQVEYPDYWLQHGNPWEVERTDVTYPVRFYGHVVESPRPGLPVRWEGGEEVIAVAFDTPIPGYKTYNTLNVRLWSATPAREFDLQHFNEGNYMGSVAAKQQAEAITHVLYPNDNTPKGKELRLKQQYFFVSASLKDMIRRFKKKGERDWKKFPQLVAIQLNDTHPSLGIPELMRLLVDEEFVDWDEAWEVTRQTFSYTNHTVLPEALERWPVDLVGNLLPRHLQIIYKINLEFLQMVEERWPGDLDRLRRLSIIEEGQPRMVRMANLCIVGSHTVNGVAALHSRLIQTDVFPEFVEFYPNKFQNKTNGVTPRRWLHQANPTLSALVTELLGTDDWLKDLTLLSGLRKFADDEKVLKRWMEMKKQCKEKLAAVVREKCGVSVSSNMLFDVQVKRIHEYKRQFMNILSVIYRYRVIKHMSAEEKAEVVPRLVLFGGKAAPGYYVAKRVIKLINNVADVINNDPAVGDLLKVVFLANYSVSLAEVIVPASDISQHISTAGMEASGTSNMKFAMNAGLIIGTLDGANIEIREEIGEDNMFIFGALAKDVPSLREQVRAETLPIDRRFNQVLALIETGRFGQPSEFESLLQSVTGGADHYLVAHDFPSYLDAQERVDAAYKDSVGWARRSLLSTAGCGKFSSDRTIAEYAKDIWHVEPVRRPGPTDVSVGALSNQKLMGADSLDPREFGLSRTISLERLTGKPPRKHQT